MKLINVDEEKGIYISNCGLNKYIFLKKEIEIKNLFFGNNSILDISLFEGDEKTRFCSL